MWASSEVMWDTRGKDSPRALVHLEIRYTQKLQAELDVV